MQAGVWLEFPLPIASSYLSILSLLSLLIEVSIGPKKYNKTRLVWTMNAAPVQLLRDLITWYLRRTVSVIGTPLSTPLSLVQFQGRTHTLYKGFHKTCIRVSTKMFSRTTVFNFGNIKKCF